MAKNGIPEWGSDVKAGVASVLAEIGGVKDRLTRIEGRVETLGDRQWWMTGIGSAIVILLLPLLGLLLPFYIRSLVRDATTTVVQKSLSQTQSLALDGQLTKENMLFGAGEKQTAIQFQWKLQPPVDPDKLIAIRFQTREPLPGITKTAALADDGNSCVMTLSGPAEKLAAITLPIDGTVSIDKR